jgi:hypothetical protein
MRRPLCSNIPRGVVWRCIQGGKHSKFNSSPPFGAQRIDDLRSPAGVTCWKSARSVMEKLPNVRQRSRSGQFSSADILVLIGFERLFTSRTLMPNG